MNGRLMPRYRAEIQGIDVSDAIVGCVIEENKDELADRVTLTVALRPKQEASLSRLASAGAAVVLYADDSRLYPPMRIWRRRIMQNGSQKLLQVNAYDALNHLAHSEEDMFFTRQDGARDRIIKASASLGIPIGTLAIENVVLREKYFRKAKIASIIVETLQQARLRSAKGGLDYFLDAVSLQGSDGTALSILVPGTNDRRYTFDDGNSTAADDEWSIEEMVTEVDVIGSVDDPLRPTVTTNPQLIPPMQSVKTAREIANPGQFGVMRVLVYARDVGATDDSDAIKMAAQIAAQHGEPTQVVAIRAPDVPSVHKGQGHFFFVGTLDSGAGQHEGVQQPFVITSVSRDWTTGEMTMQHDTNGFMGAYVPLDAIIAVDPRRPIVVDVPGVGAPTP